MPAPADSVALTGVVERIIFLNEENHYTIAEFRPEPADGRSRAEPVTIVGPLPGVECGETLHLTGEWSRHSQHGAQFKIAAFKSELPASVHGIRKYLGSGLVPGIGPAYANKIVDAFGSDTFRVLSEESGRLRDVAGIGRKRAVAIKQAWDEKRAERELYIFLQTYGVTPAQCVKLVQRYGGEARQILLREPYRVAREIDGIGFKTADRIAINLGFANDAPPRLEAGLLYALDTLQEEGHTAYLQSELTDYAAELLSASREHLTARIAALVESRQLIRHDLGPAAALLQSPKLDWAERKIAEAVVRLQRSPSGLPAIKLDAAAQWAEQRAGFAFHPLQRAAIRDALAHKISILTGGPGTGKTTCLRALVDILRAKKARVHLAAPTGRAAQRLAAAAGCPASTIHRLLKYEGASAGFTVDDAHPLATDFLIVDEASMLDARLAAALLQAVPPRAHLLLVGDTDQLPSVGAGNVLKDLIRSEGMPVTRLAFIYRQEGQSLIVRTAHSINEGDPSLPPVVADVAAILPDDDLAFVEADSAEDCLRKVVQLCTEFLPRRFPDLNPIDDVQVLAPMHKGVAGVANLNAQLQQALGPFKRRNRPAPPAPRWRGPGAAGGAVLKTAGGTYETGDKIIQLRNNYDKDLFNGDIGVVTAIDPTGGTLAADFDGDRHEFDRGDLGSLALAFAITIHKSQGSEYPIVVIPLLKAHFMMLQRNLLYTAITRGRKKVFIVGEPAAYQMAVRNREAKLRVTHLREKIAAAGQSRGSRNPQTQEPPLSRRPV
jgi:exodeoxyribonuclease V alpha subunit